MADYSYWQKALKGEFGPIHDGVACPGFYRKRTGKAAGYVPCAIWEQDGKIFCVVDGKEADAAETWSYVADKPITEQQYRDRIATGRWWDEDENVTASLAPPPAGHNQPPEAETFKDQIDAALKAVETYAEVKDDVTAAKAQSARSRLLELSREADTRREKEKKPHWDAGKAVDDLWNPMVKSSKAGADAIAKALSAHETAKAREATRLANIAAEEARKAQEKAQARAPIGVTVEPEPAPPPPVAPTTRVAGSYGRAASVRVVRYADITDQDKVYAVYKADPDVTAVLKKLAQRALDAGTVLDGVSVREERKVV